MNKLYVIAAILLLCLIQKGTCIECYSCESNFNYYCGLEFKIEAAEVIDCANTLCQKVKLPAVGGGYEPVKRGCNNESLCTEDSVCYTCDEDLCNSGNVILPIITVLSLINAIYYYLR